MDNKKSPIIEIKSATLLKDNRKILDNITISIKKGEHTAVLGPNGSGKSTFLKLLTKEFYPLADNKETIKVFNNETTDIFELRKRIGILSDNYYKNYSFYITGKELVLSGFFASAGVYSIHKVDKNMIKKAEGIIKFLELTDIAEKKLDTMSSGEINRFLLARALVFDPEILILDEPTVNLDIKAKDKFLFLIRKLSKKTTIIIVTHTLEDIIPEIKRIIMLKNGKIFFNGEKRIGIGSDNISKLFNLKINVIKKNNYYYAIKI